ncbi:hypothetical protein U0070_017463, partial [Myodes glareolus]
MLETYRNLISIGYIGEDHNTEGHWQYSKRHARIERNQNGEKKLSVYTHCVEALSYDTHLLRNEKTHTGEKWCKSKQRGKPFAYHNSVQVLKRKHTGKKRYKCNQDDKDLILYETHKNRKRTHTGEKPYECNHCEHILERNPMNVISVVRPLDISVILKCIKEYILKKNPMNVISAVRPLFDTLLFKYIKEQLLERRKPYECYRCCNAFACHSNLQLHRRTHIGEKHYECNQCHQVTASLSLLQLHKKHSVERNAMIVIILVRPLQNTVIFKYTKDHSRKNPYEYTQCGYAFGDHCTPQGNKRTH